MPPLLQGFITVAKPLDFERTKRYNVRVMARDKGEERQSSVVEVIIIITIIIIIIIIIIMMMPRCWCT